MTTNADQILADLERARAQAARARADAATAQARGEAYAAVQFTARAQSNEQNAQALEIQYNAAVNSPGTASAGQVVSQAQAGRADKAVTQNPQPTAENTGGFVQSSTGLLVPADEDQEFGTDGRIRPLTETQATPPAPPQPFSILDDDGNVLPVSPSPSTTTSRGAGAPTEDATNRNTASTQQIINANFSQRIDPRPNILDQYASYTYSLTWYLITPQQFNAMSVQNKKNISGWQILVQSAGAPVAPGNGLPGRNEFFSNDYYMDNLVMEQILAGKGSGSSQHFANINFTLTEPNGAVFLENLKNAVATVYKRNNVSGGNASFVGAQYVMCIRFYGYNEFGELLQVGKTTNPGGGAPGPTISTDVRAVVEKFIPFNLKDIKFKLTNRAIEYQIEGVGTPYFTAFSSQRGTIPFDYELAGSTVSEVLNGRPVGTKYSRTDGRVDTPQPPATNPTSPVNPGNQAGVNELGNFTGTTSNPFTVVAP
jgi:hypothetical protein